MILHWGYKHCCIMIIHNTIQNLMLQINIEGYVNLVLTYWDHTKLCLILLLLMNPVITKIFYFFTAFKTLFENRINNNHNVLFYVRTKARELQKIVIKRNTYSIIVNVNKSGTDYFENSFIIKYVFYMMRGGKGEGIFVKIARNEHSIK